MRGLLRIALSTALVSAAAVTALAAAEARPAAAKSSGMMSKMGRKPVMMTPDQLKWVPNPGPPEVKMATVWGDSSKGPHGAFHKFPAGFTSPLHTHSSDLRIVVISGTMAVAGEDGKETKLPPGSYFFEPNTWKHVTKCEARSECVAFVTANGKFDLKPAEEKKEGAAK